MSRTRMHRSHSHSHSQASSLSISNPYSIAHTSSTLGQGATVVRTPLDATMFMSQTDSAMLSRQSSLRESTVPPRTAPDEGTKEYLSPQKSRPTSPVATAERTFVNSTLRQAFEHESSGPTRPLRMLGRSPSAPTAQTTRRAPVDTSTGYQPTRRMMSRASASTLYQQQSPTRRGPPPASPSSGAATNASLLALAESPSRHRARPSNASIDTLSPPSHLVRTAPSPPLLVSRTVRPAGESTGPSVVLVTLLFGFSLDAEPNTHAVTVTMDTLRPAGGVVVDFLDKVVGDDAGRRSTTPSTPAGSVETMTDGSSCEDSDFECDVPSVSTADGPAPPRPPRRQYPTPLPPLADLPAALAKLKAEVQVSSKVASKVSPKVSSKVSSLPSLPSSPSQMSSPPSPPSPPSSQVPSATKLETSPSTSPSPRRPRASTCPVSNSPTVTSITVLLQRDASAWHAIASRLCAGRWPSLDGRRRRVEDECRWAGMGGLLEELSVSGGVRGKVFI